MLFDFMTTTAGLYARAALPDLDDPVAAFPRLAAEVLPPLWRGLFVTGLLATIMSTVDSYGFVAAVTGGRDLWARMRGRTDDEAATLRATRLALPLVGALSVGLALWSGSVVELWHHLGSVGTPVLLGPVVAAHGRWRIPGRRVAWAMGLSAVVSLGWLALGGGEPWLGVEAIFPGLGVSGLVLFSPILRT